MAEMISVDRVSEMLGVGRRTVWRMVEQGRMPQPVKFNARLLRWDAERLRAWIRKESDLANKDMDDVERALARSR